MLQNLSSNEVGQIDTDELMALNIGYRGLIAYAATRELNDFLKQNFKDEIIRLPKSQVSRYSRLWDFGEKYRDFLIEGDMWLITSASLPANVFLDDTETESIIGDDGSNWGIFKPEEQHKRKMLTFHWRHEAEGKINRRWENAYYPIYCLPVFKNLTSEIEDFNLILNHEEIMKEWVCVILTNGRGSMLKTPLAPSTVHSKYDALLMANLSQDYPEDRLVVVKCSRDFLCFKDKTYESNARDCVQFVRYPIPTWRFEIKDGELDIVLLKRLHLVRGENTTLIEYQCLQASAPFEIQITYYLEWRSYHEESHAVRLEKEWDNPFTEVSDGIGFVFSPYKEPSPLCSPLPMGEGCPTGQGEGKDNRLLVKADRGEFVRQPHWYYNFYHSIEASRGQEAFGDGYSPGFFLESLNEGERISFVLTLEKNTLSTTFKTSVQMEGRRQNALFKRLPSHLYKDQVMRSLVLSLDQFIVKRGKGYTVIAGYPWFLDWGRDTLICVPGLISAGFTREVAGILTEFAEFTTDGMLPNTIFGKQAGNFDTVDAPLWFIEAVKSYVNATKQDTFIQRQVKSDGSTLLTVMKGIIEGFAKGTGNGIKRSESTGFIYSPSHFTWMDTQYPACTPRQGYPIEIQGLWINALKFVAGVTDSKDDKERYLSWADKGRGEPL